MNAKRKYTFGLVFLLYKWKLTVKGEIRQDPYVEDDGAAEVELLVVVEEGAAMDEEVVVALPDAVELKVMLHCRVNR